MLGDTGATNKTLAVGYRNEHFLGIKLCGCKQIPY